MEDVLKEKIEFAREVLEHNSQLVSLADTKAGIILGINGIILVLLFSIDLQTLWLVTKLYLICTGILLALSSVFAVLTILPRLTTEKSTTKIYFDYVAKQTRQDYLESWKKLSLNGILEDYVNNIHNLAKLQTSKFSNLSTSVVLIIIGVVMLTASLILFYSTLSPSI